MRYGMLLERLARKLITSEIMRADRTIPTSRVMWKNLSGRN